MFYLIFLEDHDDPILFEPLHTAQNVVEKLIDYIESGYLGEKVVLTEDEKEQITKYHYYVTPEGAWYIKRVRPLI